MPDPIENAGSAEPGARDTLLAEKLLKALPPAANPARAHRPFG